LNSVVYWPEQYRLIKPDRLTPCVKTYRARLTGKSKRKVIQEQAC
jgi:hypothetical protein